MATVFARLRKVILLRLVLSLLIAGLPSVRCEAVETISTDVPAYRWANKSTNPKMIVLCIHGLTSHGRAYDELADNLARNGYLVVAPDLPGSGELYRNNKAELDYDKGIGNIAELARTLRTQYPTVPIIGLGESLGAALVVRLAADHPDLIDGVILSNPPVKRNRFFNPRTISRALRSVLQPHKQMDVTYYMKRYMSPDSRVVEARLNDPLGRNYLSAAEIMKSAKVGKQSMALHAQLPPDIPVMMMLGGKDGLIKGKASKKLFAMLPAKTKVLRTFPEQGHVMLQTPAISPDVEIAVSQWLSNHAQTIARVAEFNSRQFAGRSQPVY